MTFLSDSFVWSPDTTEQQPAVSNTDALINRCLAGDNQAYVLLYQQHAAYIYRLVYSLLQNREDAEEVLQDAFEYAFRRLDHFDANKSAFKTWLYRIAISRCRNKRRRKWLPTFSLNLLGQDGQMQEYELTDHETPQPEEALELTGRQQLVWEAIGQLSDKLRATAVLRYYEGMSYEEIGQVLDIPAKTAESRMRLAHKSLRDSLDEELFK